MTKCVHVEFYGLPGSGKSTISHMVAKELMANGFSVCEPSFYSDHLRHPILRKIVKLYKTLIFSLRYPKSIIKIYKLLSQGGISQLSHFLQHILNIAPKLNYYIHSKDKIYIWDEGLIQSSISASLEHPMNTDIIAKELFDISKNREVIKIYVKIDIDTALKRLEGREKHDSRVEKEQDFLKKNDLMKKLNDSCDNIDGKILRINNRKSNNIDEVYKYIVESILQYS